MSIEITDSAFKRVLELTKSDRDVLRIAVDGGGCAGFTYNYEITQDITEDDIIFEGYRAKIVIDSSSLEYMKSSKVDFVEELGARYFSINNPKAISKCGCGNSFGM